MCLVKENNSLMLQPYLNIFISLGTGLIFFSNDSSEDHFEDYIRNIVYQAHIYWVHLEQKPGDP
jgi:hypothetical protein